MISTNKNTIKIKWEKRKQTKRGFARIGMMYCFKCCDVYQN